jgi:hypothetical protein
MPMANDLLPAKPKSLTDEEQEIARLMVYGLPHEETILGKVVKPDWPLTLEQAAKFVGYRLKRARTHLDNLPEFSTHRRELLDGKRSAELPRSLATAIEIRDDPGENSAADRTVRLKAISVIEGNEGKGGVVVNVNQTSNVATITPGYVIRLPALQPVGRSERLVDNLPEALDGGDHLLDVRERDNASDVGRAGVIRAPAVKGQPVGVVLQHHRIALDDAEVDAPLDA